MKKMLKEICKRCVGRHRVVKLATRDFVNRWNFYDDIIWKTEKKVWCSLNKILKINSSIPNGCFYYLEQSLVEIGLDAQS